MADGASYILVAYPEPFELENFSYGQIYDLFREIGIPVPETVAMDGSLGIVLQEDLGDTLLQGKLEEMEQRQKKLLMLEAIDCIVKIQDEGSAALKPDCNAYKLGFDKEKLVWELRFFHKHYLGGFSQAEVRDEEGLFREYERLATELAGFPRVLCHRDFHVRNIMVKGGVLYLIDFQDARWGPPAYDLASLLKDSLELDTGPVDELKEYYLGEIHSRGAVGISSEVFAERAFSRQFHLMCIQRLLKALGTYGFQASVLEKVIYVQYVKGTLRRVLPSLRQIPEFPEIESMVEQELGRRE
jgi:aminoglycoside/choline kinase family phosphotransferase